MRIMTHVLCFLAGFIVSVLAAKGVYEKDPSVFTITTDPAVAALECEPTTVVQSYTGLSLDMGDDTVLDFSRMTGTLDIVGDPEGLRVRADLLFDYDVNVGSAVTDWRLFFNEGTLIAPFYPNYPRTAEELIRMLHKSRLAQPVETVSVNEWIAYYYAGKYYAEDRKYYAEDPSEEGNP